MNGEHVSEDDDDTCTDDDCPGPCDALAKGSDSDDHQLIAQGDPPLTFDDAFSADVELMKAMGLPLGFCGRAGVQVQEVVYSLQVSNMSSFVIIASGAIYTLTDTQ